MRLANVGLGVALLLAAACGGLTAIALGATSSPAARTVTISVATGPRGATGPAGPRGEPGPPGPKGEPQTCPAGSERGDLVINHPGGQVTLRDVCLSS